MIRIILLTLMALISYDSIGAQRIEAKDGDLIKVTISQNDVSRLAVEGKGRLNKIWSPDNYLDLEPDRENGEAFFKAVKSAPKSFSFFARDDFGNTFTILATQASVPSQTIILSTKNKNKPSIESNVNKKPSSYKKHINLLIKSMFHNKSVSGYDILNKEKIVPLWNEVEIRLINTYTGQKYSGEVYAIRNKTSEKIIFHETEFFGFGKYVVAAGLEQLSVGPNQTTKLYVVRSTIVEDQQW